MLKILESNVIASASEQLAMESNVLSNLVDSIVKFLPSVLNQASVAFSGFNKESSEAKHAGSVNIESLTRRENALRSRRSSILQTAVSLDMYEMNSLWESTPLVYWTVLLVPVPK
jgi:hypothetical protein